MLRMTFAILVVCLAYSSSAQRTSIKIPRITGINAGHVVAIVLDKPFQLSNSFELQNPKSKKRIQAQLLDSVTMLVQIDAEFAQGPINYSIIPVKSSSSNLKIATKENGLAVEFNDHPILFYHTKEAIPPPDSSAFYRRSGFIHPLYSPSGKILTDDFPVGHAHQHAIFTAWASTRFRTESIDFWNQHQKKGTVEHVAVEKIQEGPLASQIWITLSHKSHQFGEVLKETWTLTIYPSGKLYAFDLQSVQQNTSSDTLFLKKYHYGGLAIRGSAQWNHEDSARFKGNWKIVTSEGIKDSSANATRARWVMADGPLDQSTAGVVVFNHPANFRYPQTIRVHPTMPYWAYAPVADGEFYIPPGGTYRSKFRFYTFDGQLRSTEVEDLFNAWHQPIKGSIISR